MKKLLLALASIGIVFSVVFAQSADASVEGFTWAHKAGHWPVVYIENHTDMKHWNVYQSTVLWGSGLHYGKCRAHYGCMKIYNVNQGADDGILGTTYTIGDSNGHFENSKVVLNSYYITHGGITKAQLYESTLHELGHVLGLGHDTTGGVMNPTDYGGAKINSYERSELHRIYGVKYYSTIIDKVNN